MRRLRNKVCGGRTNVATAERKVQWSNKSCGGGTKVSAAGRELEILYSYLDRAFSSQVRPGVEFIAAQ